MRLDSELKNKVKNNTTIEVIYETWKPIDLLCYINIDQTYVL